MRTGVSGMVLPDWQPGGTAQMPKRIYPLILKPAYKDYIWGGDRIIRTYHRNEPPGIYAESWEVSDRPEGMTTVCNGAWAGSPLADLVRQMGAELIGEGFAGGKFPLLIKLIDSRQRLSVQVHPDDSTAKRLGSEPKTEAWYVLEADVGARVFAGLRRGVGRAELMDAMAEKNFESILRSLPVNRGDVIFIPGGRVHAIDAGCLLYEVQQNSNTTYRLYDWDRTGPDGRPRKLHIREALESIHFHDHDDPRVQPTVSEEDGRRRWRLLETALFTIEKVELRSAWDVAWNPGSFRALFVEEGRGAIESPQGLIPEVCRGASVLLPAALKRCTIRPVGRKVTLLVVSR
ncbi:MAG TPA: mannose-6-phosphate isomerase [Kiritimatiellae bacterium]|nr:mannose-6-phosphate isomerase [Kiritimatiellia bacterium]